MNYGSFSVPYKFVVERINNSDSFVVKDSRYPRDGSYYNEDMKNLFPKYIINEMNKFHKDGTYERLQIKIDEQVKLYYNDIYSKYD